MFQRIKAAAFVLISLSPFLKARGRKEHADYRGRMVPVLLQGIAAHSTNVDNRRFEEFGNALKKLGSDFEQASDEASALLVVGFALRLLQEHGHAVENNCRERHREMQEVTTLMTAALLELAPMPAELRARLSQMQIDLAAAVGADDIRSGKVRLADCLAQIRARAACEQGSESPREWPLGGTDRVTGLPDADSAGLAIASVWNDRYDYFAAVLTLDRLETINLRFGIRAGDQMLQALTRRTSEALGQDDRLYRWRGPCLLILMSRDAPESHVSLEVSRLASNRSDGSMTFREREAIVPLSASWDLFALSAHRTPDELLRQVGSLAGSRTRQGRRVLAAAAV